MQMSLDLLRRDKSRALKRFLKEFIMWRLGVQTSHLKRPGLVKGTIERSCGPFKVYLLTHSPMTYHLDPQILRVLIGVEMGKGKNMQKHLKDLGILSLNKTALLTKKTHQRTFPKESVGKSTAAGTTAMKISSVWS